MVAPHIQLALPPSPAEPSTKQKFPNIRRDRHKRDASTRQAQHGHQHQHQQNRIDTRGRTRRFAPTRRICFNERHDQSRTKHKTQVSHRPARSAHTRCIHPASAAWTSANGISTPKRPGWTRNLPSIHNHTCAPLSAMPGGMWSGCAGSRTFQPPGMVNQWTFGGCQGGHRQRWSKSTNRFHITPS